VAIVQLYSWIHCVCYRGHAFSILYTSWICSVFDLAAMLLVHLSMGMPASGREWFWSLVLSCRFLSWPSLGASYSGPADYDHSWFIMYFGHLFILWPHTLGGICYSMKLLINAAKPPTCPSHIKMFLIPCPQKRKTSGPSKTLFLLMYALILFATRVYAGYPWAIRVHL